MNFQENPSKGRREPAEKNFVLQAKCPELVTDQNQTCTICSACMESAMAEISRKSLTWKMRYTRKHTFFPQVMFRALVIDSNHTCTIFGA
jgi:Fe-S oxidoreductase